MEDNYTDAVKLCMDLSEVGGSGQRHKDGPGTMEGVSQEGLESLRKN